MLNQDYLEKLVSKDNIFVLPFDKHSKNDKYIIYQNNEALLFVKVYTENPILRATIERREKGALSFFNESKIIPVPMLINSQLGMLITSYEGKLLDVQVEECLDQIVTFHTKSLEFEHYPSYFDEPVFANDRRIRGVPRLEKHANLLKDVIDTEQLLKYVKQVPPQAYEVLPKILTHGDLHRGNIHRKENGDILFNDFERAYFDYPTWDMARALFDVSSNNVERLLDKYILRMEDSTLVANKTKDNLKTLIFGDCAYRIITDMISDKQSLQNAQTLEIHTKRNTKFLERYIF